IAMSATSIYNLVDALWVSGLGADALAAVGFFFPFFFGAMSIAVGLGTGGGAAVSRRIGANDKEGVDNVALHTIIFMVILACIFTVPLYIFSPQIFGGIGAGRTTDMAVAYGRVMFAGTIFIFFMYVGTSLLRGEGDAKRSMYALMLGSVVNIVLDPIFIYILGLGVAGAAWATVLSMAVTSVLLFYWLFIRKDTYISLGSIRFKYNRDITKDIARVAVPSALLQASMAITMLITIILIVPVGATDGVAVYTVGWRVSMIAILPLLGIATAVVSVTGAAYGAKEYDKLKLSHRYSVKVGAIIETVIALLTIAFAAQITAAFTQAEDTARIADDLVDYFRIMALFYPGVAWGMMSSSLFQGTGKGLNALTVTVVRTLVLTLPLIFIFAFILDFGLVGVWLGIVCGNLTGSFIAYGWATKYLKGLMVIHGNGRKIG
ncbi:MAG: MATE family efflux transporter, partial [Thermoplasmata archaeon]